MSLKDVANITSTGARPADPRLAESNEAIRQARAFYDDAVAAQIAAEREWERAQHADPIRGLVDPDAAMRARHRREACQRAVLVASEELQAAKVARMALIRQFREEERVATVARIDAKSERKERQRQERSAGAAHALVEAAAPRSALDAVRGRMERLVASGRS